MENKQKRSLGITLVVVLVIGLGYIIGNMFVKTDERALYIQTSMMGRMSVIEGDGSVMFFDPSKKVDVWGKNIRIVCDTIVGRNKYAMFDTTSYTFEIEFDTQVDKLLVLYQTYDRFVERVEAMVTDKARNSLMLEGEFASDDAMKKHIQQSIVDDLKGYDNYKRKYRNVPSGSSSFPFFIFL